MIQIQFRVLAQAGNILCDVPPFGSANNRNMGRIDPRLAFDKPVVQKEKVSGIGLTPGIYRWRKAGKNGKEG
jgi:hypothetical protein